MTNHFQLKTWGLSGWPLKFVALSYLVFLILIPLSALFYDGFHEGLQIFLALILQPSAWAALKLTLWTALMVALLNGAVGTLTAYVLVRYEFPGKTFLNALVDLPFAIPSLVTGVMLILLYGPEGLLGSWLQNGLGWQILFAPPAIIIALLFINFPVVVRTVQPLLEELDYSQEEAAATLGASPWRTFRSVVFPALRPAVLTGMLLTFARALGEFGAIVVVAGNLPLRSQTASVYVWGEIESENRLGASAMSIVLLVLSFALVFFVDWWQEKKGVKHASH